MSKGKQNEPVTIAREFYLGAQLVLCYGPIDYISKIIVDTDKLAWEGAAKDEIIQINKPELFGGNEREGGITGPVNIQMGLPTQMPDSYLQTQWHSTDIPAFRGITQAVLRHTHVGTNNYYLKPWKFRATRVHVRDKGVAQWQNGLAEPQSGQMNPIHIIRECLTSRLWGLGYAANKIDETSFVDAAQTLFDEQFGLSFLWNNSTEVGDFINNVLSHIDGSLYMDRITGKFKIKLVRKDYVENDLLLLDENNIEEVSDFKRSLIGELTSSVTIKFWDAATGKTGTAEARDIVLESQQEAVVHADINMDGITSKGLAQKVAHHKLLQMSTPIYMCRIKCNREAENLYQGFPFRLSWPDYLNETLVMRVTDINLGTATDQAITITAVQDIFSAVTEIYDAPPGTGWIDPINVPMPVLVEKLQEIPYYTLARNLGDTFAQGVASTSSYIIMAAAKPTSDSMYAGLWTHAGGAYKKYANLHFAPFGYLSTGLIREVSSTIVLSNHTLIDLVDIGEYIQINDEILAITNSSYNSGTGVVTLTVNRGVLDTVPTTHAIGSTVFCWNHFYGVDAKEWILGETVYTKLTTVTPKGTLPLADATETSILINGRLHMPYAPGNVKINGNIYPTNATFPLTVSWSHRNRLTQTTENIIPQTDGNIGPEAGVTYLCRLYDDTVLKSEIATNLTSCTFAPDPYYNNVKLLLHCDGTNGSTVIEDSSETPKTVTVHGAAALSTSISKFGSASLNLPSNGSYITHTGITIPAGERYTLEGWIYPTAPGTLIDNLHIAADGEVVWLKEILPFAYSASTSYDVAHNEVKAFDKDITTWWSSGLSVTASYTWIQGQIATILQSAIPIYRVDITSARPDLLIEGVVQGSLDGVTFVDLNTFSGQFYTKTVPVHMSVRYIRIVITNSTGWSNWVDLYEISFYGKEIGTGVISYNSWNHFAICRESGGLIKSYANGTMFYSFSDSAARTYNQFSDGNILGNLDEICITGNNTTRYIGNFTPPVSPFTASDTVVSPRIELESIRGGVKSYQKHNISFNNTTITYTWDSLTTWDSWTSWI